MKQEDFHLSDQQLLSDVDGEISLYDEKTVRGHLEACWKCRARRRELEGAIDGFIRAHQRDFAKLPPAAGGRALLKAQLSQLTENAPRARWIHFLPRFEWRLAAAIFGLLALGMSMLYVFSRGHGVPLLRAFLEPKAPMAVSVPDSRLTPGAAILASRQAVCALSNTKNKAVSMALQRQVFAEYGISGAEPQAYEVDYLVTPALGGADDIRNLWPHSYQSVWNARVKDALEDRLRDMVCDGSLDLSMAQREIAEDWIGAYRKYFHTERPLE